jgi:outer membrane protein TolC
MRAQSLPTGRHVAVAGLAMFLGGCAGFSPDAGMAPAIGIAASALKTDVAKISNEADAATADASAAHLLKAPLSSGTAVRIALLKNKDLQAAFNDLGVSEARFVQASLPPAPQFSLSWLAGMGDVEIARQLAVSLFDLVALPERSAIAESQFRAAQWRAAEQVLRLATNVRRQYYIAVAAAGHAAFLGEAVASAQASAELARQLGEAGSLNKLEQAREDAFYSELAAQLADARVAQKAERERLIRLMGLWGRDIDIRLPRNPPPLPRRLAAEADVEAKALRDRVDLKVARHDLDALARLHGLTSATRFVTDFSLALQDDRESGPVPTQGALGANTLMRRGLAADFTIPIYDFGEARVRGAEEAYMAAANRLAQRAIGVRSQAREAYLRAHGKYEVARIYEQRVLPLRKTILDQDLLQYNGMLTDVTQLIADARARIISNINAINARRDFFLALADLDAALLGGGGVDNAASAMPGTSAAAIPD